MTTTKQVDKLQGIEYSIHGYEESEDGGKWEKEGTYTEMAVAMATAEKLFKSGPYKKVEVKQKYFDKKKGRNIDVTLKVFAAGRKKDINVVMILVFAVLCGGFAFGVTYFLNK